MLSTGSDVGCQKKQTAMQRTAEFFLLNMKYSDDLALYKWTSGTTTQAETATNISHKRNRKNFYYSI